MATLKLAIAPADSSPGWKASWSVDGVGVGSPIVVDGRSAQGINAVALDFEKLFDPDALGQSRRPLVEPPALRAMGRVLFEAWFAPVWATVGPHVHGGQHRLLIQSADSAALNLPWELVKVAEAYEADRGRSLIERAFNPDAGRSAHPVNSPWADRPHDLHADRDSFDGCGSRYAGAEGLAQVDLQAVAVVDARDAHAGDSAEAAEDLKRQRLRRPCLVDRRGLRHSVSKAARP